MWLLGHLKKVSMLVTVPRWLTRLQWHRFDLLYLGYCSTRCDTWRRWLSNLTVRELGYARPLVNYCNTPERDMHSNKPVRVVAVVQLQKSCWLNEASTSSSPLTGWDNYCNNVASGTAPDVTVGEQH